MKLGTAYLNTVCFSLVTTGGTKAMPPILSQKNVTAVTMKFTWMIHISFAIIKLFFQKVCFIFNKLLLTLSKTLYTTVVKFPVSTSENVVKTLFQFAVICKTALQDQAGGSWRVPDLGCEQDAERQFMPPCDCLM
jgi:hypothetical protein